MVFSDTKSKLNDKAGTGKSFSEALISHQLTRSTTRDCSLNSSKNTSSEHVVYKNYVFVDIQNNICTQHVLNLYFSGNSMNNFSSYCGLTDSRMRASDTDLPLSQTHLE